MFYESYENFQYDSCVSRGICSINPRTSALQTVLVLYLRIFAKYTTTQNLDIETKNFILNAMSVSIYNPEFNENSFVEVVNKFREILPNVMQNYAKNNSDNIESEKEKAIEIFNETSDIVKSIQYGEKIFQRSQEEIPAEIRDLFNIILVIANSLSVNLLDLMSFGKQYDIAFEMILNLLSKINLSDSDTEILKQDIYKASEIDNTLMQLIREAQEERYGLQNEKEVTYSTEPGKSVLVVGSNIRELEDVLEALKDKNIDVYTHDDMMLAHTFPKFSEYKYLKGQFGQGVESCLLDFATFPGPIILTKHSLHNIENLYRGRLFTTDFTSPKGVIKINENHFEEVIESALSAKGFKTGKQCESVLIGYDFEVKIAEIVKKIESENYNHLFFIGLDNYYIEQRIYFEKLIKLAPQNVLILSFSYNIERENLIHVNTCFDSYSMMKFYEALKNFNLKTTVFIPKCERNSISQMVYLSKNKSKVFVGKCMPIILNPSLMNTLKNVFEIEGVTSVKADLEKIF